jgi:hypothetical protein
VADLDKTSLRGCHCKLDQLKLLRAEAEVLADDYELDASEVTTRTEAITAEEKQVCAELEEMAVTAARVCARDVARLEMALAEPGLDGSIRDGMLLDVRDRVLELGELSVIAARAKAREVAQLEMRSRLPTSVRKAAQLALQLWACRDDRGEMCALAAKAKAQQALELSAQLEMGEEPEDESHALAVQLDVVKEELGAFSAEGAKWHARQMTETRRQLQCAMSWSRRVELREYLARRQLEAGMLAEEGASWMAKESGRMLSQLEGPTALTDSGSREDVEHRLEKAGLELEELFMLAASLKLEEAEGLMEAGTMAGDEDHAEEMRILVVSNTLARTYAHAHTRIHTRTHGHKAQTLHIYT